VVGSYVSLPAPTRITDNPYRLRRANAGQTLAANSTLSVPVTGVGTAPYPSVAALNVTAVDPRLAVVGQGPRDSAKQASRNPGDGGKSYV
jgi:hypothetical protein